MLDIVGSDSRAANLLRGVTPGELFDRIKADPRLLVPFEGLVKNKFKKFLAALGARSSAVCAAYLGSLYEQRDGKSHSLGSGHGGKTSSLRRSDGSYTRPRRKPPNLFTMAQFKPLPKPVSVVDASSSPPLISGLFSAESPCGSFRLSVDFAICEDMIVSQLLIDDLSPGDILHSNTVENAFTLQMSDHLGSRLLQTYGTDVGYSGYSMLHSVLGDNDVIDTADARNLKPLRVFISTLKSMTCNPLIMEELDCVLLFMRGIDGLCSHDLPISRGLWLGVEEVREFAGTDNIFIWRYEEGLHMGFTSSEKVPLSCLRRLDSMDQVLLHHRMFRKLIPAPQDTIVNLLSVLADKVGSFLRLHISKLQPADIALDCQIIDSST